jgi:transcriptional regulator with GAF, ATPase, and Fis domain
VLDGLAGGLAETEVDSRIDRLVRAIGGTVDAASVCHLGASAGRVRQALRQAHRRQAELSALYATARDLAALRDLDEVLLAIVRRAQELMPSADAAYMVTRDAESGGFRMRASVGLVSPAFKNVHVPPGTGMSARIEQTRSAFWTRVYLSTSTIRHDNLLDRALAEDGLTSVLGTPLLVRSVVVGVLFAANRVERSYSREEMAALSALLTTRASRWRTRACSPSWRPRTPRRRRTWRRWSIQRCCTTRSPSW